MRREEKEQQWDVLYVCLCVLTKASVNSWKAKARHLFACLGFHLTFFASLFTQLNKYISKGVPCMLRESKSKRTTIRSNTNTNVNAIPHATRRVHWRLRSVNIGFCLQTRKRANWLECEIRDLSIYELTFLPNNITRIYKPSPGNKFCCLFSFFAAFTKALTLALASRAHIRTHILSDSAELLTKRSPFNIYRLRFRQRCRRLRLWQMFDSSERRFQVREKGKKASFLTNWSFSGRVTFSLFLGFGKLCEKLFPPSKLTEDQRLRIVILF